MYKKLQRREKERHGGQSAEPDAAMRHCSTTRRPLATARRFAETHEMRARSAAHFTQKPESPQALLSVSLSLRTPEDKLRNNIRGRQGIPGRPRYKYVRALDALKCRRVSAFTRIGEFVEQQKEKNSPLDDEERRRTRIRFHRRRFYKAASIPHTVRFITHCCDG